MHFLCFYNVTVTLWETVVGDHSMTKIIATVCRELVISIPSHCCLEDGKQVCNCSRWVAVFKPVCVVEITGGQIMIYLFNALFRHKKETNQIAWVVKMSNRGWQCCSLDFKHIWTFFTCLPHTVSKYDPELFALYNEMKLNLSVMLLCTDVG